MTGTLSRVTEQDISFFQEQGYIRYEGFFSAREMSELRDAIDRAIARNRERIRGAEGGGRGFRKSTSGCSTRWSTCGRTIRSRRHSRSMPTWPRPDGALRGAATSASTTTTPWSSRRVRAAGRPTGTRTLRIGAWIRWARSRPGIAVDDVTVDNGCLHFVPGSHRYGRQEPISLTVAGGEHHRTGCRRRGSRWPSRSPWRWPPRRRHLPPRLHLPLRRAEPHRHPAAGVRDHLHTGLRDVHRRQRRGRRGRRDDGRRPVGSSAPPDPGGRSLTWSGRCTSMPSLDSYKIEFLRPDELRGRIDACPVAFVPLGTLEWHGHHNPIGAGCAEGARRLPARRQEAGRRRGPAAVLRHRAGHPDVSEGAAALRQPDDHAPDLARGDRGHAGQPGAHGIQGRSLLRRPTIRRPGWRS